MRKGCSKRFSIVSVILAAGELEKDVPKRLKKLAHEQQFEGGKHGWGSVRMACVDLEAHKLCVSRMGDSLKNIMKAVLWERKTLEIQREI